MSTDQNAKKVGDRQNLLLPLTDFKFATLDLVEAKVPQSIQPLNIRWFYQRLRDTPKIKDCSGREGRGFKGIRLRATEDKIQEEGQTQLISNAVTAVNRYF